MGPMSLPPGFRFHPTDKELVGYYLKRKVDGLKFELEVIPVVDLYKFDPWELPDKSFLPKRDLEWFFFCPRDRKYPNGSRTNRATGSGYWKATGKDRKIICDSSVYGLRKTLVFYRGRAPGGDRTDWVMHEYRLCEDLSLGSSNFVGAFALCRVVKRNEHDHKIGDLQGKPKAQRDLSSAMEDESQRKDLTKVLSSSEENPSSNVFNSLTPTTSLTEDARGTEMLPIVIDTDQTGFWGSNALLSDASKAFLQEEDIISESILPTTFPSPTTTCSPYNLSPVSSYTNFTEEAYFVDDLNGNGYLPSFPSPVHCMGMYNNEETMDLQSFTWEDSARYTSQPISGTEAWNSVVSPSLCRQTSEELANLWLQEDSLVIVM